MSLLISLAMNKQASEREQASWSCYRALAYMLAACCIKAQSKRRGGILKCIKRGGDVFKSIKRRRGNGKEWDGEVKGKGRERERDCYITAEAE